ncbi:hypothetical protein [Segatella oris]|uniref:hypothetical protein n=1 Tax=Segatella oris TaxID=28135 RepID=UPI0012DDBE4E|nr:hypothetical protein [Segatella oris]
MSGKYEKSRFVGVRRTKISEKRLSPTRENQKSAKISFPSWGKIRNLRKTAFLHGGKSEISKKRLSSTGENQKSAKIGFPPRGKIRNQQKSAFPREGKQEISEKRLSPARENQKTPLAPFPTPQKNEKPRKFDKTTFRGQFTFYILSFGIYRPGNCYFLFFFSLEMTLYSEGDMP